MFISFVVYKIRNSKKNTAATPGQNGTESWALTRTNKAESVASDDHAKSSVSTYISAMTRNTEPSFYDRNHVTGASSSSALTDFSRLPLDPPPSPVTERALSTMTDTNNRFHQRLLPRLFSTMLICIAQCNIKTGLFRTI